MKNPKAFEYIALTKEDNGWRIGTFDSDGCVEDHEVPNIDAMVKFIQASYGMKPAEVKQLSSMFNVLNKPPRLLGISPYAN